MRLRFRTDSRRAGCCVCGIEHQTIGSQRTEQPPRINLEEPALPYDESAHNRANMAIDSAMTAHAAAENQQFLTKAAARPGARTLQDGLVFETIIEGEANIPPRRAPSHSDTQRFCPTEVCLTQPATANP